MLRCGICDNKYGLLSKLRCVIIIVFMNALKKYTKNTGTDRFDYDSDVALVKCPTNSVASNCYCVFDKCSMLILFHAQNCDHWPKDVASYLLLTINDPISKI